MPRPTQQELDLMMDAQSELEDLRSYVKGIEEDYECAESCETPADFRANLESMQQHAKSLIDDIDTLLKGYRYAPAMREDLARRANEAGQRSRIGGAPILTLHSTSEEVARWLQWCDPNGCHTATLACLDGFPPHTLETAWAALEDMLSDAEPANPAPGRIDGGA